MSCGGGCPEVISPDKWASLAVTFRITVTYWWAQSARGNRLAGDLSQKSVKIATLKNHLKGDPRFRGLAPANEPGVTPRRAIGVLLTALQPARGFRPDGRPLGESSIRIPLIKSASIHVGSALVVTDVERVSRDLSDSWTVGLLRRESSLR